MNDMEQTREYDKLFVGGDLSGIQKFLYNISSKKAAASLKGRSATLREEMRTVCDELQSAIRLQGVSAMEELYCSGGKFYFIAGIANENVERVCQAIDAFLTEKRKQFWTEYMGMLGINICYVRFAEQDDYFDVEGKYGLDPVSQIVSESPDRKKGPGRLWEVVNEGFVQQKNQKFKEILLSSPQDFFGDDETNSGLPMGANYRVCAVTGMEFDATGLRAADITIGGNGQDDAIIVHPSVRKQVLKGQELNRSKDSFEQYVDGTDMGILRMDVDRLGKRFIDGFDSLEEYKSFSAALVDFFEHEIEMRLLTETFERPKGYVVQMYQKYLNVIYAGGDDLFVVGRWDKLICFAKLIHDEVVARFAKDGISISGGVVIVHPKFPIAKAADMAGEAESMAKRFNDGEKNAFCLFGKAISWNGEFDKVEYYKDKFVEYIGHEKFPLSKSILHKIMLYSSMADMNKVREKEGKPQDFSYIWHISYYMSRYMEPFLGYKNVRDEAQRQQYEKLLRFCTELKDRELVNDRGLELVVLAARWAERILRDGLNKN